MNRRVARESANPKKFAMARAPSPAREARALPGTKELFNLTIIAWAIVFNGCGMTNYYAPPVVDVRMTRTSDVNVATLQKGRILLAHRCIECHALPPLWHYSREDWPEIVNSMSHRASLKPAERDAIVAYILAVRAQ